MKDKVDRGNGTVCLPEMRKGRIGLCVGTQIGRYSPYFHRLPGWNSPEQAWAQTQGQLAWYRAMEERGELVAIRDRAELERHIGQWNDRVPPANAPIGYVLSLEGADSIVTPRHLERAYAQGLRAVGPAHYGPGVYAQGTNATGVMGPRGHELLREMERLEGILRTKTAEGKAQTVVIALMPVALVGTMHAMMPGYFAPLETTAVGNMIVVAAVGLWIGAIFVARQILAVDL